MTIRVVHGVVSGLNPGSPSTDQATSVRASASALHAAKAAPIVVNSDAAVTAIRTARPAQEGERIKDYKEAKDTANDIADRVRNKGEGVDAHAGLSYVSAPSTLQ